MLEKIKILPKEEDIDIYTKQEPNSIFLRYVNQETYDIFISDENGNTVKLTDNNILFKIKKDLESSPTPKVYVISPPGILTGGSQAVLDSPQAILDYIYNYNTAGATFNDLNTGDTFIAPLDIDELYNSRHFEAKISIDTTMLSKMYIKMVVKEEESALLGSPVGVTYPVMAEIELLLLMDGQSYSAMSGETAMDSIRYWPISTV